MYFLRACWRTVRTPPHIRASLRNELRLNRGANPVCFLTLKYVPGTLHGVQPATMAKTQQSQPPASPEAGPRVRRLRGLGPSKIIKERPPCTPLVMLL